MCIIIIISSLRTLLYCLPVRLAISISSSPAHYNINMHIPLILYITIVRLYLSSTIIGRMPLQGPWPVFNDTEAYGFCAPIYYYNVLLIYFIVVLMKNHMGIREQTALVHTRVRFRHVVREDDIIIIFVGKQNDWCVHHKSLYYYLIRYKR